MADEAVWKRRFAVFMAARLFGLLTFFAGIGIAFGDYLRPGGWPLLGGVLILVGLVDAIVAPKMLKKHWKRTDGEDGATS